MIITKAPNRRFVETPSDNPLWQLMHRISDKYYPAFRDLMQRTWDRWRNRLDMSRLFDALLANNHGMAISEAEKAWMSAENDMITESRPIIESMMIDSINRPLTREMQLWINRHTGEFITQIGTTERQAIRDIIMEGMRMNRNAATMARDIQQHIGLTAPQAKTISRLRATMQEAGIPASRIEDAIQKRIDTMLEQRAQLIARNETILASKEAYRQSYLDDANQGLIDAGTTRRFWIITPLDACEICRPIPRMNPNGVGIREPFITPIGPLMNVHAHIQCRCVESLRQP